MGFGPRFEVDHTVNDELFTVVMRGYAEGDATAMADMLDDYRMQQFVLLSGSPTAQDEQDWLEGIRHNQDVIQWMVSVRCENKEILVGTTGLRKTVRAGWLSSGILLCNTKWWGKGIASTTHRFRTWYAFRERGYLKNKH